MTLVRLAVILGVMALAVLCLGLTMFLGFLGYAIWATGYTRAALALWAAACCPIALIVLVLALVPDWSAKPTPPHTTEAFRV